MTLSDLNDVKSSYSSIIYLMLGKQSESLQCLSLTLLIYYHKGCCQLIDCFNEENLVFSFSELQKQQIKIYSHMDINRMHRPLFLEGGRGREIETSVTT